MGNIITILKMLRYALIILLLCTGCKSTVPVSHTTSHTDSTIIREKLVPIEIKGSTVTQKLSREQYDSLLEALKHLPKGQTIYMTDRKMQTQLQFALDSIGRLIIQCQTLDKEYQAKVTEKDRIITEKDIEIREQQKSFVQRVERFLENGLWFLIIAVVLLITIQYLLNRKRSG